MLNTLNKNTQLRIKINQLKHYQIISESYEDKKKYADQINQLQQQLQQLNQQPLVPNDVNSLIELIESQYNNKVGDSIALIISDSFTGDNLIEMDCQEFSEGDSDLLELYLAQQYSSHEVYYSNNYDKNVLYIEL